jgi:hypothetical protein
MAASFSTAISVKNQKRKLRHMTDEKYDPLQKKIGRSKAELEKLFTGDSRILNRLKNENPELFESYRAEAVEHGLLAPRPEWANPNYRDRYKETPLTEDEIRSRASVSREECLSYYAANSDGNHNNLSKLAKENPERYKIVREASIAHGIIAKPQPKPYVAEPRSTPENRTILTLSDEQCDRIGVKHGHQVDEKQYLAVVGIIHEIDTAKAQAESEARREAAIDSSVATYGHLKDTPEGKAVIAAAKALESFDGNRPKPVEVSVAG